MFKKIFLALLVAILCCGCGQIEITIESSHDYQTQDQDSSYAFDYDSIPAYEGEPYVEINRNLPLFEERDLNQDGFETYSDLDELGRCGVAYANLSKELMPTKPRGSIAEVRPSGWNQAFYDHVESNALYNRCHLIGYQLAGENANEKNLITGTRYMNTQGMLPFENMIADYLKETNNHVLYRVTPIFIKDELVARGVVMEAYSIEDDGEGICFNVFAYNVQPNVVIDYQDGSSYDKRVDIDKKVEVRGNKRSKIYHLPDQSSYDDMANSKNLIIFDSEREAIEAGYQKDKTK